MSTVVLSRALTSADDGTGTWDIVFTTADGMFNKTLAIATRSPRRFRPRGRRSSPRTTATVSLPDNSAAGMAVWTGTVTNSDGSAFNGTVNVGGAPLTFTP